MAELNPSIILGVQPLNYLQTVGNAVRTADAMNTVSRQNALADLYSTDGAGIANGD